MIYNNIKMAITSIRSSRVRSLLTMLGVIIGVSSVVIIVSLGEGVRNQVIGQINQLGSDIISIRPGKSYEIGVNGQVSKINLNATVGVSTLTEKDIEVIKNVEGVEAVSYNAIIAGNVGSFENPAYSRAVIIATPADTPLILNQKLEFGEFFKANEFKKNGAVIGSNIAAELYKQRDPIGRVISIRGVDFNVRGVLAITPENPLNIGTNYNYVIYIPIEAGKKMTGGSLQISEFNVKIADANQVDQISEAIRSSLVQNHLGQEDFTILKQSEYMSVANQAFNILTTLVAAIAAISLLVGGIGIMNIMLVGVSERTNEIGVRKAIGATNRQILSQFLIESTVISLVGGLIGILVSLLAAFVIRLTTSIHPSISLSTIIFATSVSIAVGIVFGMAPAIQAARKDPIEALRHE